MENKMMTKSDRDLRTFEALQIALATEDAKQMSTTPEIERQVEALYAAGRQRMAQVRYAENSLWPVKIVSGEVRPEILSMAPTDVHVKLGDLRVKHPEMQYAHREGETLSDHDLRSMLEDATRVTESKE